jgi:hypothetical protein
MQVVERGPHHRVVTFTRPTTNAVGEVTLHQGRYTELENGLHYLQNGEWIESEEVVEPAPLGAVAPRLSYRAAFAANSSSTPTPPRSPT